MNHCSTRSDKALRPEVLGEDQCGVCGGEDGQVHEKVIADIDVESDHGEARPLRKLVDPRKPSEDEVEEHNKTHMPYRNWCPHCVKGKGKDLDHRKAAAEERGLREHAFNYCFAGDEVGSS